MKIKLLSLSLITFFGNMFSQIGLQTYSTSGSFGFTVPVGITSLTVEVVGAGGSGGGNGSGGGGGGGYAIGVYSVVPGATHTINVGSGGLGSGLGTTSMSGLLYATGGGNGTSVPNPGIGGGGTGGVGTGGTIANRTGGIGGGGYYTYFGGGGGGAAGSLSNGANGGNTIAWTGICLTPGGTGGTSGGAPAGNGGKGAGFIDGSCTVSNPSAAGAIYGAGGGGGNGNGGGPGTGAVGYCKISWNTCTPPVAPTNSTSLINQTICTNNSTTLTAIGTGTVNWYASATSTVVLGTGSTFTTPILSAGTYSYYAASTNTCSQGPRTLITVTVNALPIVTVNSGTICSGQSFTMVPSGAITYFYPGGSAVVSPTVNTNYNVYGTNAAGCTNFAVSSVTVYAKPTITVNSGIICLGQSFTMVPSGALTYTYTGGSAVVSPTVSTNYNVYGTNAAGCSNFAVSSVTVSSCVGVQNTLANNLNNFIYPNPNNGRFTIELNATTQVVITNILGDVIFNSNLNSGKQILDIQNKANGIYFIKFIQNGKQESIKFIKE